MARENFHTALVTSSPREYVEVVFDTLPINEYFNTLVTGEMVTKGKPDPECYLVAAKELDVDPATCVVMEDSPAGVQAGKAAGMTVIAVPSHYVKEDPSLGNADLIVGTLHEVTLDYLMTL
jgi:sugar-phosphatase